MTPLDETIASTQAINGQPPAKSDRPRREDAENAIRLLLQWLGEDPSREGLRETPGRVIRAFEEHFSGYGEDPGRYLATSFKEVEGYDDLILLEDIPFSSHCEHHMVPIIGRVSIGYVPDRRVVGISKLARVVDGFARRLQIQEAFTRQIATCIDSHLQPKGVAVVVSGQHHCMNHRGVRKTGATMRTRSLLGCMTTPQYEERFHRLINR